MPTIGPLNFTNRYSTRLPAAFYTRQQATPLAAPYLVSFNPEAAGLLDLPEDIASHEHFAEIFAGNRPLAGQDSLAALYAGHQFGVYVPQLGDGRALWLGEIQNSRGEYWELQLKGSGQTPYSRMGDGRAVLRSSIREYLCSEAMAGLGIPTTRALCITGSDEPVYRETVETAAVVLRMSPSFIRFGSFEVFYYRNQHDLLRMLADLVIDHHYPLCHEQANPYLGLLEQVVLRTARLIAQWQAVGFCHGVMNSDNMSILGLTIDYGPFGFLDAFDPGHICNHSDHSGRYAYHQQPQVGLWNLHCLAQALLPLMDKESALGALHRYQPEFDATFHSLLRAKLGLLHEQNDDIDLLTELYAAMAQDRVDHTLLFRLLCDFQAGQPNHAVRDLFIDRERFDAWANRYSQRLHRESSHPAERAHRMKRINPKFVLRNHMAETAIRRAVQQFDFGEIDTLRRILCRPFDEHDAHAHYAGHPPDWATTLSVSCSS